MLQQSRSLQPDNVRLQGTKIAKASHPVFSAAVVIDRDLITTRAVIADYMLEKPPVTIYLDRNFYDYPRSRYPDKIEYSFECLAMVVPDAFQKTWLHV